MNKKIISYIPVFLLGMGLSIFGGCSNDMETDSSISEDGLIPVNVVMQGYQDMEEGSTDTRSINENSPYVEVIRQDMDIPGYEDYEMVTTIEKTSVKEVNTRANMNNNARVHMYVFDTNGTVVADWNYTVTGTTATFVGGTPSTQSLATGTYKFVCVTYNSDKQDATGIDKPVENGEDFATCHLTKAISATDNTIPINFVRQVAQFQVSVSASGFSNNTVTFSSVDVSNLYSTGTWTLNNNTTDNTLITGSGTVTRSFNGNTANKIIPVSRSKEFTLRSVVVEGSNKGDKKITIATSFERGRNYNVRVSFVKKIGILLGSVIWAPGNLRYVNGTYSFFERQDQYTGVRGGYWNATANPDYWSYNTLTPTSTSANNGDPCTQVAPAGTWRMPTRGEFEEIMRLPNIAGTNSNRINGYFFGVSKVPSAAVQATTLFFPIGGYRNPGSNAFFDVGIGSGYYWSSTYYDTTQAYALYLYFDPVPAIKIYNRNKGINIRCVRNP